MDNQLLEVSGLAVLGATVLALYYLFDHIVRKYILERGLGLEDMDMPLPGPIRWTVLFAAIVSGPALLLGAWILLSNVVRL